MSNEINGSWRVGFFTGAIFFLLCAFVIAKIALEESHWHCSNHQPSHMAFTTEEIAKRTKEHGCTGWTCVK
jgi:hypothetical protein